MDENARRAREIAAGALGHPVPHALAGPDDEVIVAASVAGDPPAARVAWVDRGGRVIARVACPPGRPSRWRPVVAAAVALDVPGLPADRVLVARLAPEAASVRPVLASEDEPAATPVGEEGLALVRLPPRCRSSRWTRSIPPASRSAAWRVRGCPSCASTARP